MKLNLKSFIVGFLLSTLLISLGSIAVAKSQGIDVFFNHIKIKIDGEIVQTDVDPFIYSGRTYVPIRFVAEKFGKKVKWNETENIVEIGDTQYFDETPAPTITYTPTKTPTILQTATPTPTPNTTRKDETTGITIFTIDNKEYVDVGNVSSYISTNITNKYYLVNTPKELSIHWEEAKCYLINNIRYDNTNSLQYDIIFDLPIEMIKRTDILNPYINYNYYKNTLLPYLIEYENNLKNQ